jgi:predicted nucleotidyltransferase
MSAQPQQERPPDLESLRAARGQILAAASRRGLREVRVFGSVARGEAVETSDVDLLVAPGPETTWLRQVRRQRCSTLAVSRWRSRRLSDVT